jgi:hypothetical protein
VESLVTDHHDALETGITVTCPVCKVDIPCPHMDEATEDHLSITLDRTWVEEHVEMHQHCTCRWSSPDGGTTVRRITNLNCEVHA